MYVKAVSPGARAVRLTESPADEFDPVWSPDGRQIAFLRTTNESQAIHTVPWPGGQERKLIDLQGVLWWAAFDLVPDLSWAPDGESLVFAEKLTEDDPARIVSVSLTIGEKHPLTSPPAKTQGDLHPAFSPDGRLMAFARSSVGTFGGWDVWVQPTYGGSEARRLTHGSYSRLQGLEWVPDGTQILFTTRETEHGILRVPLAGGDPTPVLGGGAGFPSVRGTRMVHVRVSSPPWDVWRAPGRRPLRNAGEPRKLIASTQNDTSAAYSPDGNRIAFESNRSGTHDVWVCHADGSNPVQLTFDGGGPPRWSPDGRQIVFDSTKDGDSNLYVVDVEGGTPRRLTPEHSDDAVPSWSRDGRFVYFQSNRSGSLQIWKIPSAGGEAVQMTRGGGSRSAESWDGRTLFYARGGSEFGGIAIWKVPAEGGEETEVVPGPVRLDADWALVRDGLYYATPEGPGRPYTIDYFDFATRRVTELLRRDNPFLRWWMTVSPDEAWVLFGETSGPKTSELMLVENFR